MCIIVDTNVLGVVLNRHANDHLQFKPVLDWVINGRGRFIFGGTKYNHEIKKYLSFFLELTKIRKAVLVNTREVDTKEQWAAAQIQHKDFDDQHLVGLLLVSKCKLICSLDKAAYPYFTHASFFKPASSRPRIYNKKRNAVLLTDQNMADMCKPGIALKRSQKRDLNLF